MVSDKMNLIQNLAGVHSSKLNYYVELKKKNRDILLQNRFLEIIHQIVHGIIVDMSLEDIVKTVYSRLPLVLPCDFLGLALRSKGRLCISAMAPENLLKASFNDRSSVLWQCVEKGELLVCRAEEIHDDELLQNLTGAGYYCRDGNGTLAVAPLFCKSAVRGVLFLGSRSASGYSEESKEFIKKLADQLAVCIQNVILFNRVSRAKSEWEATFTAVTDPIFLIDTEYNIIRTNGRFSAAEDTREIDSGKCYRYIWGRNAPCEDCPWEENIAKGEPAYRRHQKGSGAAVQTYDSYYYPITDERGNVTSAVLHLKDVTEKIKMEAQLIQSAKLAAIGEMAAGVAHELNNPMTVIIGTAQMLQRDGCADEESLTDIINSGLRCKKIIQNLLTFSRQDSYPLAPVDLNDVVEKVLSLVEYQINKNKITIVKNLAPGLPEIIANSQQLQQVLINFLLNARDAIEEAGREGLIEITTGLRGEGNGRHLVLAVKDNGTGIDPGNLDRIFNPFYTSKEAGRGTGLGLSVSMGIAQAHGGDILVESEPGVGSVFTLVLPVAPESGD